MITDISIKLLAAEAADEALVHRALAAAAGKTVDEIKGFHLLKQSIDARSRTIYINISARVFINEPPSQRVVRRPEPSARLTSAKKVLIVGAGPAGLFAALRLLELGIKPVIVERGKDVRDRRRDLAALNKEGIVNPDSNYCFGEGGAGTYSDGKLYTRSKKRGDVDLVLEYLHVFGASENILFQNHPHIGTNKLPHVITAIREFILSHGGIIHFTKKLTSIHIRENQLAAASFADGDEMPVDALILATGHSARDIFLMLHRQNIHLEPKPLAIGVRVEHQQSIIDASQYHCVVRPGYLPASAYSLVQQVNGRGVFSFCMCPGGIIAPASTAPGELVVNGWSPSKRDNAYANSGMVTEVRLSDLQHAPKDFEAVCQEPPAVLQGALGMMYFQQYIERKAWQAGGGEVKAPAQHLKSFVSRKFSSDLPGASYLPGLTAADLTTVLPSFIYDAIAGGLRQFDKRIAGYVSENAVAVATESRTSSPVRIPRLSTTLQHPQVGGLFPCAEGAGYAGGIVSAALDGMQVANAVAAYVNKS